MGFKFLFIFATLATATMSYAADLCRVVAHAAPPCVWCVHVCQVLWVDMKWPSISLVTAEKVDTFGETGQCAVCTQWSSIFWHKTYILYISLLLMCLFYGWRPWAIHAAARMGFQGFTRAGNRPGRGESQWLTKTSCWVNRVSSTDSSYSTWKKAESETRIQQQTFC